MELFFALPVWLLGMLAVLFIVESILLSNEYYKSVFGILLLTGGLLETFELYSVWALITTNWLDFILNTVKYIGIGIVYSLLNWAVFLFKTRSRLSELKALFIDHSKTDQFIKGNPDLKGKENVDKTGKINDSFKVVYKQFLDRHSYFSLINETLTNNIKSLAPSISKFKGDFFLSVVYWPLHMFSTMFADIITLLIENILEFVNDKYQRIANKMFEKFNQDI